MWPGAVLVGAVLVGAPAAGAVGASGEVGAGANLLVNPSAEVGAFSAQGWDAVTIPGWRIAAGLPTVVRYGTRGFPAAPGRRGRQLFAGGAGGSARLSQVVSLRAPDGDVEPAGVRYRVSAWLGGTTASAASVTVTLLSGSGRVVASRKLGPVGARRGRALVLRVANGVLPHGMVRAEVTVNLSTSLTNADGPNAPLAGYNRAVADDVRFSLSAPVRRAPSLHPPAARVPRFDHVFLFYFENQDYRSIIGNRKQAPYLNSLLPRASLLANLFAEEHPSDANYLALAGGGAFGIPLTDPLEARPRYTIRARNLGDLVDAAGATWRAYLEGANGPGDDTVHGNYWNDDEPFLYFADIRGRPAYCASHVIPLDALRTDLASPATTPSLAWVGPDDCDDMEGCGIRAGDRFLAGQLGAIMASPAWRTQRSLAIITFDEDAYDHERPAQHVATLVLGSAAVRAGYVSHVRYTHYSLLRTIEAALGLGTLTRNDRYAQATKDVFEDALARARARTAGRTDSARPPIAVGAYPFALALSPDGSSAYVANYGSDSVTPIDVASGRPGPPIPAGTAPDALAVTPDGKTLEVVSGDDDALTPIALATGHAGRRIPVGYSPAAVAVRGGVAYVVNTISGTLTPIRTRDGRAGRPISVGRYTYPLDLAFGPGRTPPVVLDTYSGQVTLLDTRTHRALRRIKVGGYPIAAVIAG